MSDSTRKPLSHKNFAGTEIPVEIVFGDFSSDDDQQAKSSQTTRDDHLDDRERRLVIRASAGTGKTFQLSNRYISLLRHSAPDRILASTFTRKAAGEILERILIRLAQAALDVKARAELSSFIDGPEMDEQECQTLLQSLTQQLHRVRVSTLDGFFARLSGAFSLELGLPPGWRMVDELTNDELHDQAIETVLRKKEPQDTVQMMHLLDKGKTSRRVHDLILEKVSAFLGTYHNSDQPAWEQFPKVSLLTDAKLEELTNQIEHLPVSEKRQGTARDKDLELIRDEDWEAMISKGIMKYVIHDLLYYKKAIVPELKALYLQLLKHIRAVIVIPWSEQSKQTYALMSTFDGELSHIKTETKGLHFDDITRRLASAMSNESPSKLAYRLDGNIDHVLLDEFQDTSPAQWSVLRPFAKEACADPTSSFFCVGDTKQAIYSWRGGEAAIFDAIESELDGVKTKPLNKSFRSSPVIMDTVNAVFGHLGRHNNLDDYIRKHVEEWSAKFPEHETALTKLPGYASLMTCPAPQNEKPSKKEKQDCLFQFTATKVREILKAHPRGTIGILTRKNSTVGRMIFQLTELGIDASEEGGTPLTDSAAVQLILSLMQMTDHPGDTTARFHIAKSPLGEVLGYQDWKSETLAVQLANQTRQQIIRHGFGPLMHHLAERLAPACNEREFRRLTQLATIADNFDVSVPTLRMTKFVEFVERERVAEPTDARVRVMTVHQSKGLEFDTVILPELDQDLLKSPKSIQHSPTPGEQFDLVVTPRSKDVCLVASPEINNALQQTQSRQMEEALCLLYVAMTRARNSLLMIIAPSTAKKPSSNHSKTFAGLVHAALAPNVTLPAEDETLYEIGDPNWFQSLPKSPKPHETESPEPKQIDINFADTQQRRGVRRLTPSRMENERFVRLANILPIGNAAAMNRGTLFHSWMEQIQWLDSGRPDEDTLKRLAREQAPQHLDIDQSIEQFYAMIQTPAIVQSLTRATYQQAQLPLPKSVRDEITSAPIELDIVNERQFSVIHEGGMVNGTIDRLVLMSRSFQTIAADIIDFKTDALPDDPVAIEQRIEHYRNQMAAYVYAVSQIYGLPVERISARLVLLSIGRVETVTIP